MTIVIEDAHKALQEAFEFFNAEIFGGRLYPCLITLRGKKNSPGFYARHRFKGRVQTGAFADEIALNPVAFQNHSDEVILADLAHQMVHFYQHVYGDPHGKDGYHDREWADLMIEYGLIPVSNKGRQTGYKVSHYIKEGGKFQRACQKLLATGFRLPWEAVEKYDPKHEKYDSKQKQGEQGRAAPAKPGRVKFTCPDCGLNTWAKDSADLLCGTCSRQRGTLWQMHKAGWDEEDWDEELQEWPTEELNKLDLVPFASPRIRGLAKSGTAPISRRGKETNERKADG